MTRAASFLPLLLAVALLGGCAQSDYEACVDEAKDEFYAMQQEVAQMGGDVGGIMDGIRSSDAYAIDQCS